MVGGLRLERWAPSLQNGGRHQIGSGGRLTLESALTSQVWGTSVGQKAPIYPGSWSMPDSSPPSCQARPIASAVESSRVNMPNMIAHCCNGHRTVTKTRCERVQDGRAIGRRGQTALPTDHRHARARMCLKAILTWTDGTGLQQCVNLR